MQQITLGKGSAFAADLHRWRETPTSFADLKADLTEFQVHCSRSESKTAYARSGHMKARSAQGQAATGPAGNKYTAKRTIGCRSEYLLFMEAKSLGTYTLSQRDDGEARFKEGTKEIRHSQFTDVIANKVRPTIDVVRGKPITKGVRALPALLNDAPSTLIESTGRVVGLCPIGMKQ